MNVRTEILNFNSSDQGYIRRNYFRRIMYTMEPISIILLGILGLLIVGVLNFSFKGGQFTCSRYILNTYMYIFLAIVIMMLEILGLDKLGYKSFADLPLIRNNLLWIIPYLILQLVILIVLMYVNPQNVVLKHSLWLLLILMLGTGTLVFYKVAQGNNTLHQVLLILVGILGMFTAILLIKPEWISMSWGPVLLFSYSTYNNTNSRSIYSFQIEGMLK